MPRQKKNTTPLPESATETPAAPPVTIKQPDLLSALKDLVKAVDAMSLADACAFGLVQPYARAKAFLKDQEGN